MEVLSVENERSIQHRIVHSEPLNLVVNSSRQFQNDKIVSFSPYICAFIFFFFKLIHQLFSFFDLHKNPYNFLFSVKHFFASNQSFDDEFIFQSIIFILLNFSRVKLFSSHFLFLLVAFFEKFKVFLQNKRWHYEVQGFPALFQKITSFSFG